MSSRLFQRLNLRRRWRFWVGTLLSLVALLWLAITTDWVEVWEALKAADYRLVLAAVGLNLLTIPLRTWRWRLLFPPLRRPQFRSLTSIMLIGQALNVFTPFRLGDLVRASLVESENTAFVLGTQVLRIALDLFVLAGLVFVLLFQVTLPAWWRGPGELLLISSLLALSGLVALIAGRRHVIRLLANLDARWPFSRGRGGLVMGAEFLRSLEIFSQPILIMTLLAGTIIIWGLYAAVNYVLLAAVGAPLSWLAALFLLAVLQLGVAIPSSPGRVGVYHYLAVQALGVFGVDQATAVTYAVLLHLISVMLPAGLGAILAWRSGIGRRSITVEAGVEGD